MNFSNKIVYNYYMEVQNSYNRIYTKYNRQINNNSNNNKIQMTTKNAQQIKAQLKLQFETEHDYGILHL